MRAMTASAVCPASGSRQPSARRRSATAPLQPAKALADASRTAGLALTDSVAIGSIGHPSRRSDASCDDQKVDPAGDDVGDGRVTVQEPAQQPFDLAARRLDDGGRQLLFSVRKVVIERAGLDVCGLQDLVHTRGRVALPAEQQGRGVYQRGTASIGTGHPLTILERSLKNT